METFPSWEEDTFQVFDEYLDPTKNFIDFGGWIGTTCLYASHKSSHVYVVEADRESLAYLKKHSAVNNRNITIIENAIYNSDGVNLSFGPNKFMTNAALNDSTSQIHLTPPANSDCYSVASITLRTLLHKYAIDPSSISLIKVDIEGGEEYILEELLEFHETHRVPMYISFHYTWWSNSNLSRFTRLTDAHIIQIIQAPFSTILLK